MGYMIEGGGSKTLSKAKKWLYAHPEKSQYLLTVLSTVISDYLIMQIEAGAQLIQVFDSSAEYLNKSLYEKFCLPHLKRIAQDVKSYLRRCSLNVPLVSY